MKNVIFLLITLSLSVFAQGGDSGPKIETKDGKPWVFDYSIPLKGISDASLQLSQFAGEELLVFYFSAKCPHCMRAYPKMQEFADRYSAQGLKTIAIASGYNKLSDIHTFIGNQKVRVPMLQDSKKQFGKTYGVGTVPLVIYVNSKGEFIRFRSFDRDVGAIESTLGENFGMIFQ